MASTAFVVRHLYGVAADPVPALTRPRLEVEVAFYRAVVPVTTHGPNVVTTTGPVVAVAPAVAWAGLVPSRARRPTVDPVLPAIPRGLAGHLAATVLPVDAKATQADVLASAADDTHRGHVLACDVPALILVPVPSPASGHVTMTIRVDLVAAEGVLATA